MKNLFFHLVIIGAMMHSPIAKGQDESTTVNISLLNEQFVYLKDSTLLLEGEFTLKERLGVLTFRDTLGNRIWPWKIKFYQDEEDYYGIYGGDFKPRIVSGTLDIFYKKESDQSSMNPQRPSTYRDNYYYARGSGNLKKATYKNLRKDLIFPSDASPKEKEEVLYYLELGQKRFRKRWILIGSGIFTLGVGARIYQSGKNKESSRIQKAGVLVGLTGVGLGLSSVSIPNSEEAYYDALISYNIYF